MIWHMWMARQAQSRMRLQIMPLEKHALTSKARTAPRYATFWYLVVVLGTVNVLSPFNSLGSQPKYSSLETLRP